MNLWINNMSEPDPKYIHPTYYFLTHEDRKRCEGKIIMMQVLVLSVKKIFQLQLQHFQWLQTADACIFCDSFWTSPKKSLTSCSQSKGFFRSKSGNAMGYQPVVTSPRHRDQRRPATRVLHRPEHLVDMPSVAVLLVPDDSERLDVAAPQHPGGRGQRRWKEISIWANEANWWTRHITFCVT